MARKYIEVSVDLGEFDDIDILDEVEFRLNYTSFKRGLVELVQDNLEEEELNTTLPTMVDEWKRELFMKHYDKFTLEEFEEFLKSKKVVL
jgi:hypothetical protein